MPPIGARHKVSHQNAGGDEISVLGLSGLLGDSQTPLAHKTSHQDGGADEISVAGLAGGVVFVPYNGKIADIYESDTNKHTLNLATPLSETRQIIGLYVGAIRVTGTASLGFYPNEGSSRLSSYSLTEGHLVIIASGTQRLQYNQNAANDDWDLFCFGYFVVGN